METRISALGFRLEFNFMGAMYTVTNPRLRILDYRLFFPSPH